METTTGEILVHALTASQAHEGGELPGLLAGIEAPIAAVSGDGAYDAFDIHAAILARDARPVIPPRKGRAIRPPPRLETPAYRGAAVVRIRFFLSREVLIPACAETDSRRGFPRRSRRNDYHGKQAGVSHGGGDRASRRLHR